MLKAGIIGCGNIYGMHAISLNLLDDVKLAAVCDVKEERAKNAAQQYNCTYYTDYKKMIENEGLDVVHICTPHYLHAEMAVYAANKGVNILTEKPMSIKLEDAEAMIKAAKDNNVVLGVIFQNRYNPGSKLIKETLQSGKLGKIISGRALVAWHRPDEYYIKSDWKGTWDKEGGGVVIDQAIHTLDLLRWFVNDEIEYVDANIYNRAHEIIEVEDSAEGVIKYKNGVITGFMAINYYGYDAPVEIELYCENGIAKMTGHQATIKFNDFTEISADRNPNEGEHLGNGFKLYWGISHKVQITKFYDALKKGEKIDITGDEAIKTQKMICAIYDSGKSGKRIYF
ncbi:MAG: UDP-N-acetyl-2-amino-2-deoxyglucuronate dehydrogenase [Petroclostridium sp.]|jgi:predicted dehydrogenase|nr:UDP-N-acetyl-2-amino-2-deoxyglucuronate dehydrogenase [Petroclostridium sp.]